MYLQNKKNIKNTLLKCSFFTTLQISVHGRVFIMSASSYISFNLKNFNPLICGSNSPACVRNGMTHQ